MKRDILIFLFLFSVVIILTSFIVYTLLTMNTDTCLSSPLNYTYDFYKKDYPHNDVKIYVTIIGENGRVFSYPPIPSEEKESNNFYS